jgi:peptidoglycan/LPS O-acetylase OafA/YrhL
MTYITSNKYGYSSSGQVKYFVNRLLRIFPTYWASIGLMLLVGVFFGFEVVSSFHELIAIPTDGLGYFENIFLCLGWYTESRFLPQAWALTTELIFYGLIGIGISKTKCCAKVWFGVSIMYMFFAAIIDRAYSLNWLFSYFYPLSGSLAFASGSMIFHYRSTLHQTINKRICGVQVAQIGCVIFIASFVLNFLLYRYGYSPSRFLSFYANYVCQVGIIICLISVSLPSWASSIDKKIGDYSYPIYLNHYACAILIWQFFPSLGSRYSIPLLVATLPVCFVLAWVFIFLIEKNVERVRDFIKQGLSLEVRSEAFVPVAVEVRESKNAKSVK